MAKKGMSCSVPVIKVPSFSRKISVESSTQNFRGYFWCKAQPRGAVAVLVGSAIILRRFVFPGSQIWCWWRGEVWLSDRSGGALQEEPHGGNFGHCIATQTGEEESPALSFATSRICCWNAAFPYVLQDFFLFWGKKWGVKLHEMGDKVI